MVYHQPHNSKGNYNYNGFIYSAVEYRPHIHRNYELLFVLKGKTNVRIDGKAIRLAENAALLCYPDTVHGFTVDADSSVWVGVFSADHIYDFDKLVGDKRSYSVFAPDGEVLPFLKERLFIEGDLPKYSRIAYFNMMCQQCVQYGRHEPRTVDTELYAQISAALAGCTDGSVSMKELAGRFGYEYHYFSKKFHECFSMSFPAYVNDRRLETACRILRTDDLTVTEVAAASGFSCLRSFNRAFKEGIGMTPGEYRGTAD